MILSLGLSPALQRTLIFNEMQLNRVNRALQVEQSAAGKAVNTARALSILNCECMVSGFNGGHNGALIERFLKEHSVISVMTPTAAETRICTTLIDEAAQTITELVEEAPQPDANELLAFKTTNLQLIKESKMLVVSGTLPPYAAPDFYCAFTSVAESCGVPFVIDSHGDALLRILVNKPLVAKLNLHELEKTFNFSAQDDDQVEHYLRELIQRGARNVFMTCGAEAAWLVTPERCVRMMPPPIRVHRNPIGSGDCTTAGLAARLLGGTHSLENAIRFALACGSANVESLVPADFSRARAEELYRL